MYFNGASLREAVFIGKIHSLPLPHNFVILSNDFYRMWRDFHGWNCAKSVVIFPCRLAVSASVPADLCLNHSSCLASDLNLWPKHFINNIIANKQVKKQWCEKFSWTIVRCKKLTAGPKFVMKYRQGESQVNSLSALAHVLSLLNMDPSHFRTNLARFAQKQLHWGVFLYGTAELNFHSPRDAKGGGGFSLWGASKCYKLFVPAVYFHAVLKILLLGPLSNEVRTPHFCWFQSNRRANAQLEE